MGLDAEVAVAYGEMEGDNAVAPGGIREEDHGRGGAGAIGLPVPYKAVASGLDIGVETAVQNGQEEGVDVGARGVEAVVVGVDTTAGVDAAVPVIAVAGGDMEGGVVLGVDDEMEGVGAGASGRVIILVGVDPVEQVGGVVPGEALAGRLVVAVVGAPVHGEDEVHGAVAPFGSLGHKYRGVGAGGVGDAVPGVAVAGVDVLGDKLRMVDGEVECHHAVAPGGIERLVGRGGGG